jgi:hypothetical protein
MAAQRVGRPLSSIYARLRLVLVGLVLLSAWGSLSSSEVLSASARAAMSPPWVIAVGAEVFSVWSPPEAAVGRLPGVLPDDDLGLDDYDANDDSPSLAVPTAGDLVRPSPPLFHGIPRGTHLFPQLARYLVRPQLLTRV